VAFAHLTTQCTAHHQHSTSSPLRARILAAVLPLAYVAPLRVPVAPCNSSPDRLQIQPSFLPYYSAQLPPPVARPLKATSSHIFTHNDQKQSVPLINHLPAIRKIALPLCRSTIEPGLPPPIRRGIPFSTPLLPKTLPIPASRKSYRPIPFRLPIPSIPAYSPPHASAPPSEQPVRDTCAVASAWHSGQILRGPSLSLAPSGLARELSATSLSRSLASLRFAQPRSAPGDLVGDRETSMVGAMGVERSPKDAAVGRAQ